MTGATVQAANNAGIAAGQYGAQAGSEGAQLNPFFTQEMKATHLYDPSQQNQLLTAAEAGAGGATGGMQADVMRNAARTGNSTGVAKTLDEMARDRAKAAAGASEGIAAQDVMGAKKLNQEGAEGMSGLYGTNVSGQLGAMKNQTADLSQAAQDEGPGLLNTLTSMASKLGQGAGGVMTGMGAL